MNFMTFTEKELVMFDPLLASIFDLVLIVYSSYSNTYEIVTKWKPKPCEVLGVFGGLHSWRFSIYVFFYLDSRILQFRAVMFKKNVWFRNMFLPKKFFLFILTLLMCETNDQIIQEQLFSCLQKSGLNTWNIQNTDVLTIVYFWHRHDNYYVLQDGHKAGWTLQTYIQIW